MALIDPEHPFYRPLWVRVAIVGVCLAWAALEFFIGAPFWGALFGGAGLYAGYVFFMDRRGGDGKGPTP